MGQRVHEKILKGPFGDGSISVAGQSDLTLNSYSVECLTENNGITRKSAVSCWAISQTMHQQS